VQKSRWIIYGALFVCAAFLLWPRTSITKDFDDGRREFVTLMHTHCPTAHTKVVDVVTFNNLKYPIIGICWGNYYKSLVYIDRRTWTYFNEAQRRQLLFHELTHCYLNMPHVEDPSNYMYYEFVDMPKEMVTEQVIFNIGKFCEAR
jgi:hypothetical protein